MKFGIDVIGTKAKQRICQDFFNAVPFQYGDSSFGSCSTVHSARLIVI